jgi:hypothetical protein
MWVMSTETCCQNSAGDVLWSEWRWSATGLKMARVTVMGMKQDRISWARLHMKSVEEAGQNVDEAMRTITGREQAED